MKYVIFRKGGEARLGVVTTNQRVIDLAASYSQHLATRGVFAAERIAASLLPPDLVAVLEGGPLSEDATLRAIEQADQKGGDIVTDLANVTLDAPIRPHKIFGVRRNYSLHAQEAAVQESEEPRMFFKLPQAVIGPGASIEHNFTEKMDYEAELVLIIGKKAKNIARADALDYVAGYALGNDISARELQLDWTPQQTSLAKSFDTHAPLGPWVATTDEFAASPPEVTLRCWVNDELRQEANTNTMLFPIDQVVAYLAQFVTLNPGDAIYTGTPAGVGAFMEPPGYLNPGDTVKVAADGLGELINPVIAAPAISAPPEKSARSERANGKGGQPTVGRVRVPRVSR